jgi:hypothetical protein
MKDSFYLKEDLNLQSLETIIPKAELIKQKEKLFKRGFLIYSIEKLIYLILKKKALYKVKFKKSLHLKKVYTKNAKMSTLKR